MRIDGAEPAGTNASVSENAPRSGDKQGTTFAKVLSKKQPPNQESAQQGGKTPKAEFGAAAVLGETAESPSQINAAPIEEKHLVPIPTQLQELAREISVTVNAAGQQQVHIELNSNVLKGLHIRIDRQDGAVAIQFQSSSEEIATLLSKNAEALSEALVDRGVAVSNIRIAGPAKTETRQDSSNRFRGRDQRQGGRQGRR